MRLGSEHFAVFVPADPPRAGVVAVWGDGAGSDEVELVLPAGGGVRRRRVRGRLLPLAAAHPRRPRPAHRELLATLGLEHRARHLPRQLSGGEQQRLAFARAVAGDPPPALVVADEPTAELDSASGEALLTTVQALARRGTAFVLATHDPAVERLADRTLYLRHGAMEAEAVKRRGPLDHRRRRAAVARAIAPGAPRTGGYRSDHGVVVDRGVRRPGLCGPVEGRPRRLAGRSGPDQRRGRLGLARAPLGRGL